MPSKQSRWLEISVEADEGSIDDLVVILGRHCVGGAVVEERPSQMGNGGGKLATVKGFLPVWDASTRQKVEIALLLLGQIAPISEPRTTILEPEDWAESWKVYFPPQHVGERTVIVPTWHQYEPRPDEIMIRLDPGMAFGTGLHPSTRLCLIAIERLIRPGISVLDVGTGSGILAISAALQGAQSVWAIDSDPVAVEAARENVALNQVDTIVTVERGTLGGAVGPQVPLYVHVACDLLLVNILAEVIMAMAPAIYTALRDDGWFVASGIIQDKALDVAHSLEENSLVIDEHLHEGDWVALVGHTA